MLKVKEHSELLSVQYLARCLEPENVNFSITTRELPMRIIKETLFTRHRSVVEPPIIAKDRKTTLQAIHTMAVNQAVNSLGRNVVLDDRPPVINISEKELTRKERTTLAQLRSGHCRLLGSYKSRISKEVSLDVCADCGKTPHDVKHLLPSSSNDHDTVGLMEQICGHNSRTRLSRGRNNRLRWTRLKGEQQQPLDLWADPAKVIELLARWRDKLAGGPES